MTRTQKVQLRMSELRKQLGGLIDTPAETRAETHEADVAKVAGELRMLETELQAAILADGPEPETRHDTPEGRELRDLQARASLGVAVDHIIEHRNLEGAEAELQQHFGLAGSSIPLAMLERRAVTPAPTNVGQNQQPIVPYVFPEGAAAFLGIAQPTVGVGEAIFPVLTSELSVEALAENAAGTETTGAFSASVLSPSRLQAAFFYSREDRARFAGMDASLRENLSAGLADGLDKAILAGTAGLIGTGLTVRSGDAGSTADFAAYRGLVYDSSTIDGRYAATASAVRLLTSPGAYGHAASIYRSNNADDSALDSLMRVSGGVRSSPHMTVSGNDQPVIARKGGAMDAVAPVWEGVTIIHDEVTKADNGQIKLTAVLLYAFAVLRADGFQRRAVQIA